MSWWRKRPSISYSTPSRSAPSDRRRSRIASASNTPHRIASPGTNTDWRSSDSPGRLSEPKLLNCSTCSASISRRSRVMRPSFPHRHQHFVGGLDGARGAQRVLPALNAVLPGQRFQLLRRRQPRAAEVVLLISPPGKNSWAKLTQPMRRLSASSGSKSSPITSSVDPPPMSITSLRPFSG